MAPRAYWTGNLKVSLVSFGVRLYNAVSEAERVRLNQVHKGCNARIKMPPTCPVHGQLERSEIAKAYEFEKDKYVIIEQEELDKIKLRSEKTIEVSKFVAAGEVDDVYLDSDYYVAPDGPVAEEPFRVFREALESTGTAGIGRVTMAGRERAVLLRGRDRGFVVTTLRSAAEVRGAEPYFEEIGEAAPNKEYLQLATGLIASKMGRFDPAEFHDRYQDALVELIKSKVAGEEPVIIQEEEIPTTFNFMEALKQSLQGEGVEVKARPAAGKGKGSDKAAPGRQAGGKKGAKKPPAKSQPPASRPAAKGRKRKQA
jgi:DNA end-binding protein Ku